MISRIIFVNLDPTINPLSITWELRARRQISRIRAIEFPHTSQRCLPIYPPPAKLTILLTSEMGFTSSKRAIGPIRIYSSGELSSALCFFRRINPERNLLGRATPSPRNGLNRASGITDDISNMPIFWVASRDVARGLVCEMVQVSRRWRIRVVDVGR